MKLNLVALSALVALAAAATETTTSNTATVTLSPEAKCANKCNVQDRCCVAACYHVPCPSESQANDTNRCVAACPQGNGSAADSKKYADCEQACYSSHFFPADNGAAATETSSGSSATVATGASASETGSSTNSFQTSSSNGPTKTGSSASGTSTGANNATNAAANVKVAVSGASLFGLMLAAFAL